MYVGIDGRHDCVAVDRIDYRLLKIFAGTFLPVTELSAVHTVERIVVISFNSPVSLRTVICEADEVACQRVHGIFSYVFFLEPYALYVFSHSSCIVIERFVLSPLYVIVERLSFLDTDILLHNLVLGILCPLIGDLRMHVRRIKFEYVDERLNSRADIGIRRVHDLTVKDNIVGLLGCREDGAVNVYNITSLKRKNCR